MTQQAEYEYVTHLCYYQIRCQVVAPFCLNAYDMKQPKIQKSRADGTLKTFWNNIWWIKEQ